MDPELVINSRACLRERINNNKRKITSKMKEIVINNETFSIAKSLANIENQKAIKQCQDNFHAFFNYK